MADTFQTIVQGEDRTLPLQIQRVDGASYDLTTATEITARFTNEDASILELTLTGGDVVVTDAKAGRFTVTINDTDSALLKYALSTSGKPTTQDFSVVVDHGAAPGGVRRIVNFTAGLKVIKEAV